MEQQIRTLTARLLAHRSLTGVQQLLQLGYGFLARRQMAQDHQPPFMPEGLQQRGRGLRTGRKLRRIHSLQRVAPARHDTQRLPEISRLCFRAASILWK